MMRRNIGARLSRLERKVGQKERKPIPFMVSDRPDPVAGCGRPEPAIPGGHYRVYYMRFKDDDPPFVDVPKEKVREAVKGAGFLLWLVHDEEPPCS